jgi:site-specific recombinase XerD
MQREHRRLESLARSDVERFLANPAEKPILAVTRNNYRYILFRYLDWLRAGDFISFDSAWLRVRRQGLPESAEDFLGSLKPTLKPATCGFYRQSLRLLHNWLDENDIAMQTLSRDQLSGWLQYLHAERGQGPATRVNVIVATRVYLRSLNDAGLLDADADGLIRAADLPKLPVYLPRPIAPATDEELQRRLASSEDPYKQGLLVMRNTGLRVGELSGLTIDCVRKDELGNTFLKVPLGKLNNERLVPMDEGTLAVVEGLQRTGRPDRELLLETVRGHRTRHVHLKAALDEAAEGLEIPDRLTTHRLRHTYATTMLNAGMSLTGVMKLLGHRDYRMTLRYTEITLETVGKEYRAALTQLETRYRIALTTPGQVQLDPDEALGDIIRWVQKRAGPNNDQQRRAQALVKRLKRIREEVGDL